MGAFDLQVVIPTYNNLVELESCLEALSSQDRGGFQVLVCIDGSTDGTQSYLHAVSFPFELLVLEHSDRANHGRAATRNLALRHLTAPFVVFLDSDMRAAPDALSRHAHLLARRDCVSVGDVVYENAASNVWARYLATRGKNMGLPNGKVRPLDFNTQNAALRAECLLETGGFDERLTEYGGEDTELGLRIGYTGRPFIFNAAARAFTVEGKTVEQGLQQLRRFGERNLGLIRATHPDAPAPFWIDRLESDRVGDRLFRTMLNPLVDSIVNVALPRMPFGVQRQLLNYKVIRAVFAGYVAGADAQAEPTEATAPGPLDEAPE